MAHSSSVYPKIPNEMGGSMLENQGPKVDDPINSSCDGKEWMMAYRGV